MKDCSMILNLNMFLVSPGGAVDRPVVCMFASLVQHNLLVVFLSVTSGG